VVSLAELFDLSDVCYPELVIDVRDPLELLKRIQPFLREWRNWVIEGDVDPRAILIGNQIYIAQGAVVEAGAYIKGPTVIGAGTEVRHGAYIRGDVIVGRQCVVGHTTEVKHSLFFDHAKAGHFAYIGDSILGNRVNLGAGTKLANLKVVPGNVGDTGLRKIGAIIGDDCELGCNAVTSPGTIIGKGSIIYPAIFARGMIPPRSVVKQAAPNRIDTKLR